MWSKTTPAEHVWLRNSRPVRHAESCPGTPKRLPPNKLQAVHALMKKTVRNSLPLNIVSVFFSL
eukprot:4270314-Amphidinium_carterae.1